MDQDAFPMTPARGMEEEEQPPALGPTVKQVLDVIRNAMAHEDVIYAPDGFGKIGRLVFVASNGPPQRRSGHEFVATTPQGFQALIEAWRDLLPAFGFRRAVQVGDRASSVAS
jgi:hypothetical protein